MEAEENESAVFFPLAEASADPRGSPRPGHAKRARAPLSDSPSRGLALLSAAALALCRHAARCTGHGDVQDGEAASFSFRSRFIFGRAEFRIVADAYRYTGLSEIGFRSHCREMFLSIPDLSAC